MWHLFVLDSCPIPLASGVEALHHWTHCDRVLFSCVACRKRHGIWGCRVWRAQPLMFADGHASALILTWQGFICQELLDVCGIKELKYHPPLNSPTWVLRIDPVDTSVMIYLLKTGVLNGPDRTSKAPPRKIKQFIRIITTISRGSLFYLLGDRYRWFS